MFTAAMLEIAKTNKPRNNPKLIGRRMDKLWYIHKIKYYIALKN